MRVFFVNYFKINLAEFTRHFLKNSKARFMI